MSYAVNLRSLNIAGNRAVTTEVYLTLSDSHPGLLHLNASSSFLDASGLEHLGSGGCASLLSVTMQNCLGIADGLSILGLLRGCPHIEHLDLAYNPEIGDSFMTATTPLLPNLRSLHMRGCTAISDGGVHALLASHSQQLVYLSLRSCWRVTQALVEHIATFTCPLVVHLDMRGTAVGGCTAVLHGACPNLQWLDLPHMSPPSLAWAPYSFEEGWRFQREETEASPLPSWQ